MSYYPTLEEDIERAKKILKEGKAEYGIGGVIFGKDVYAAYRLLESFVEELERRRDGPEVDEAVGKGAR